MLLTIQTNENTHTDKVKTLLLHLDFQWRAVTTQNVQKKKKKTKKRRLHRKAAGILYNPELS